MEQTKVNKNKFLLDLNLDLNLPQTTQPKPQPSKPNGQPPLK